MKNLPDNPNIEHLKAQAKDLLKELRLQNPSAKLHEAQHSVAREYGHASWPKLVDFVAAERAKDPVRDEAIRTIEQGIRQGPAAKDAARLLEANPNLVKESLTCALVGLDESAFQWLSPEDVNDPVGSLAAPPLVYAAFSVLGNEKPEAYESMIRRLLELGADPSASLNDPSFPDNPLSALYATCGVIRSVKAAEVLLDAGANINDNESLYHSTESRDHSCLKLLLDRGARIDGTNALPRMLDYEDMDGLNLFLERGPDLNHMNVLIHAIRRGRSADILARLIAAGADPDHPNEGGMTPTQLAFRMGRTLPTGADFKPSEGDLLIAACWAGDVEAARKYKSAHDTLTKSERKAFPDALWAGRSDLVDAFFAGGFGHEDRDDSSATPLHVACFSGNLESVRAVLAHNPPLDDSRDMYRAIPVQYAAYASEFAGYQFSMGDYGAVIKLMADVGSPPPSHILGSPEVRKLLVALWPNIE